jgi:hypothetical protein
MIFWTSHKPIGLHGLLQRYFYLFSTSFFSHEHFYYFPNKQQISVPKMEAVFLENLPAEECHNIDDCKTNRCRKEYYCKYHRCKYFVIILRLWAYQIALYVWLISWCGILNSPRKKMSPQWFSTVIQRSLRYEIFYRELLILRTHSTTKTGWVCLFTWPNTAVFSFQIPA